MAAGLSRTCVAPRFLEGEHYLWRSERDGISLLDATRPKELEKENGRLQQLLTESFFEDDVTREALRKTSGLHRLSVRGGRWPRKG